MSSPHLVVVGDALLDRDVEGMVERLAPDAPVLVVDEEVRRSRPGGAGLAALLDDAGVGVVDLGLGGTTPEKVRIRAGGRSLLRIDRGHAPGVVGPVTPPAQRALGSADAILVADYGRGVSAEPDLRAALTDLASRLPVVWDPHPRGSEPVPGVRLATPNRSEAAKLVPEVRGDDLYTITRKARTLAARWRASGMAITLGPGGALLVEGDTEPFGVPAPEISGGDPCGAGDRFASRAAELLADGTTLPEAVTGAVLAASSFVAAGGAAAVRFDPHGSKRPARSGDASAAEKVMAKVRASSGTVVATGGCFDLLHAGHVGMLQAARSLGDCLVVCLNSDASVRRIKGPGRPLVAEEDRAAVLEALGCVDAVVLFDEDTPEAALERLRPDVFAKGGDYAISDLPEAALLERWGGQAVILPYVEGRSTTRLIREAVSRNAR